MAPFSGSDEDETNKEVLLSINLGVRESRIKLTSRVGSSILSCKDEGVLADECTGNPKKMTVKYKIMSQLPVFLLIILSVINKNPRLFTATGLFRTSTLVCF